MVRIAICDDLVEDIVLLSEALYTYDNSFDITSYTDGGSLIGELLDAEKSIDILFLDIYMPGIDGINIARRIHNERGDIKIIFISSSDEHYAQAYEVFAFNYILKPLDKKRLYEIMDRAVDELKMKGSRKISFSYKSTVYSIETRDILYVESRDKLILFNMAYGDTPQCYGKLDEIEKELPEHTFIRCHKSFIINAFFITEMGHNYFHIGQTMISISKKYLKHAKEQYYAYLFSNMSNH